MARRDHGGHGITAATLHALSDWIAHRLAFVAANGATPVGAQAKVSWPTLPGATLPDRFGPRPQVSWSIPQQQLSQNAPADQQEQLFACIVDLPGVAGADSQISVPGARALVLTEGTGPDGAYLVPQTREFAHLHPQYDGSLHLALPTAQAADLVAHGWGVPHPWAGTRLTGGFVMVFGPRDRDELEVVSGIVTASHAYATSADR